MLQIRYSAPRDLDISGTPEALEAVRGLLLDLAHNKTLGRLEICAATGFDPAPYERSLAKLVILVGQGPTKISLESENYLSFTGSPENLEFLASFLDFSSGNAHGQHQHYEYFEGNEYIAPDSMPLVVSLKSA